MNWKRKAAALTAAALLTAGLCGTLTADAEDNAVIHIHVDKVYVTPDQIGEPVTVNLYLPDTDPEICAYNFGLRYDSRLELLSAEGTKFYTVVITNDFPGMWVSGAGIGNTSLGTFMTCSFRLPADAAPGDVFEVCYLPDNSCWYGGENPSKHVWDSMDSGGSYTCYAKLDGAVVWEDGFIEVTGPDAQVPTDAVEEPTQEETVPPTQEGTDAVSPTDAVLPTEDVTVPPTQGGTSVTLWGDADDDGDCDIMDVIAVNKDQLGSRALEEQGKANADVDRSGDLSFKDAVNILKSLVDLAVLPVES